MGSAQKKGIRSSADGDKQGFTLVELVATIIVATFLVLLGLPTLVRASQKTRQTTCQSNLRQIGFALQSYADANENHLPGPVLSLVTSRYDSRVTNQLSWYIQGRIGCGSPLARTQSMLPVLLCPGRDTQGLSPQTEQRTDFVLNEGRELGKAPFGRARQGFQAPLTLAAVAALGSPADCAAVVDADKANVNPTLPGWNALPYQPVHGKARNQLYFDWHVASKGL